MKNLSHELHSLVSQGHRFTSEETYQSWYTILQTDILIRFQAINSNDDSHCGFMGNGTIQFGRWVPTYCHHLQGTQTLEAVCFFKILVPIHQTTTQTITQQTTRYKRTRIHRSPNLLLIQCTFCHCHSIVMFWVSESVCWVLQPYSQLCFSPGVYCWAC